MWNRVLYLTTDSRNGPVSLNIRGPIGEFKGKRSCVWVQVPVERRDVEGIWLWLLAYLHLVRENLGCVVVDIQQEDLESACATCRWHTCTDRKVTYTQSAYTYLWENRFLKIYIWKEIYATEMQYLFVQSLYSQQRKVKYGVYSLGP